MYSFVYEYQEDEAGGGGARVLVYMFGGKTQVLPKGDRTADGCAQTFTRFYTALRIRSGNQHVTRGTLRLLVVHPSRQRTFRE